jgi:phosphate starvation-inducible PhoH-like protein
MDNNYKMMFNKVILILSLVVNNYSVKLKPHNIIKMQMSKKSFQSEKTNKLYLPKTQNQIKYVNALNNNSSKIIIANGPAGTGKTLFACLKAINLLNKEEINKIVITRPIIPVEEEEIGFLPGNIVKKMDPWTKPIFDLFLEYYSRTELDYLINKNSIEICPLAFMRGRTFKNSFIIADEMQNSSPNQMKMLTTRIGQNSKMVITGDLQQTDILKDNGLKDLINKVNKYNNNLVNTTRLINIIDLDNEDIERSEIVKQIIEVYNYKEVYNNKKIYNVGSYNNGDSALIPKAHISSHFDLYYENPQF